MKPLYQRCKCSILGLGLGATQAGFAPANRHAISSPHEQAKVHQEAWAKYLGVPVEYENSIGMKLCLIPPGEFLMGSTPQVIDEALAISEGIWSSYCDRESLRARQFSESDIQRCIHEAAIALEGWRGWIQSGAPRHKVILTQPLYVGVTEVTQFQYEQLMEIKPSYFAASGEGKDAVAGLDTHNHPVEMVTWNDAAVFCEKLNEREQSYFRSTGTVTPLQGTGYRLPTVAEWEYACRAGTTTRFWSGGEESDLLQAGWFGGNSAGRTHAVAELSANPFGQSDVRGKVWE